MADNIYTEYHKDSLETRLNDARETPLFYKVFALAGAGMILDAADVYMAGAINSTLIQDKFASISQGSFFLSSGFLGLFIGSILAGYIGDFYGRKLSYHFNLLLFGIFTLLSAFTPNMTILIALRFFAAIGLGAEIVTGYAVVNEFAPIKRRGHWSGMTAIVANTGAPITLLIASFMIPRFGWRSMFMTMGVLALILWLARRHFPESPRWLLSKGRTQEANQIIEKLTVNGLYEKDELKDADEPVSHISFAKGLFIAIVAVSATLLCQYTFTSWVPTLLLKQGINIVDSISFSAIMMIGAPIGAAIGALLIDRTGRKKLILTAFIATAVLGIAYAYERSTSGILINGFLLTMTLYILVASVVSIYTNELFETAHRFRGAGIANGTSKLLNVLMPTFVAVMITRVSPSFIYYAIAGLAVIAAIIIGLFGPETDQKAIK
ncbi:MFS transporter [Lentilactobacillus hilgardii]|jgi:putative MFS transporter|uniref:MFS transporter n=1 Tax=Lentilactobacillus hilgardii TaxID=1588 RepID=A0A6P1EDZ4_LENHI|nr:MFS transporter [Lentilactobacillus hilgardii]EEI70972.1 transporter, major facilitator family protein [Lentilactobacillus hilgardii ATCC 27305]MCT3391314.1 MFS transporter [Lentilactobacillus hilgardii]QHB52993.1 MFS transporter [Lentilactobacillus hilgardii]RRG12454.1 MAG: MFS transporter [Lactobacillus sp.]